MNERLLIAAFLTSIASTLLLTPLVRRIAVQIGLVDRPDAHRKIHTTPTALGGGVAVLAGVACTALLALFIPSNSGKQLSTHPQELIGLGFAVLLICVVGLLDDWFQLRARHKLLGQIAAAIIVVTSGLVVENISFAGNSYPLGWLSGPVTVFWLVACVNALNLIDGADGLASVVGIALCGTIACSSVTLHNELTAFVAVALTGSLLGFLRYNFPPASIFLGDAGSMSVGLIAGSLTIQGSIKGAAAFTMLAPLAMWLIPMMDVGMAVVRRQLTGRGLSVTDRSHLHHCLMERGLSPRQLLLVVGGLCTFCGLGSWLTVRFNNGWFAFVSAVGVVGFLISRRLFGHVEMQLAGHHLARIGRRLIRRPGASTNNSWQSLVRLQGVRPWEELWHFAVGEAERRNTSQLTLDLNLPWLHEGFHATWIRSHMPPSSQAPRLNWPLRNGNRTIGTLLIVGSTDSEPLDWIEKAIDFLSELERRIPEIAPDTVATSTANRDDLATAVPSLKPQSKKEDATGVV